MRLTFPKTLALNGIDNIIAEFDNSDPSHINVDLSEIEYVDSGTANYVLLIPFLFKDRIKEIAVDSKTESYQFLKKVGIIQEFENNFRITDELRKTEKKPSHKALIKSNQVKIFDALSSSPFLRTFLASNKQNRNILRILSKEYRAILSASSVNEYKVSVCLIELIDNIFQHSKEDQGAISVHFVEDNKMPFLFITITDLGVGFRNSLLQSKSFQNTKVENDSFYIQQALKAKVSSTDSLSRGFGLPTVVKNCDRISISSGNGNITVFNDTERNVNNQRETKFFIRGANIVCIVKLDDNTTISVK